MEYKQAPPDLQGFVDRAQSFWEQIDVEKLQPVIHGEPESAEKTAERAEMMERVEKLQKEYEEFKRLEALGDVQQLEVMMNQVRDRIINDDEKAE